MCEHNNLYLIVAIYSIIDIHPGTRFQVTYYSLCPRQVHAPAGWNIKDYSYAGDDVVGVTTGLHGYCQIIFCTHIL